MSEAADLEPQLAELIRRDVVPVPPVPVAGLRLWERTGGGGGVGAVRVSPAVAAELAGEAASEDRTLAARFVAFAAAVAAETPGASRTAAHGSGNGVAATASPERAQVTAAIAAIGAIGLDVGGLAVALVVGGHVTGPGPLAPLRRKAWRQALVAALACARLAERRGLDRQEGFVCGLLHDVGRVVALATFETVLAHTHDVRTLPAAAWEAAMNRFHVDLGLITARHWRLPSSLSTVVASHHRPELAGRHREMSELVLVADAIAELLELQARVLPAELAAAVAAAGPGGDGQELVSRLLSELPAFVAAVEEATAADTRPDHRSLPRSQIQSVPLALTGTPRPASFSVQVARASGPLAYRSSYVTADGIALTGPEPLPEHTLARLRIAAPWPIEVWATVVLCSPEGDTHRIEARLYAAEPRAQAAWDGFLARLA